MKFLLKGNIIRLTNFALNRLILISFSWFYIQYDYFLFYVLLIIEKRVLKYIIFLFINFLLIPLIFVLSKFNLKKFYLKNGIIVLLISSNSFDNF